MNSAKLAASLRKLSKLKEKPQTQTTEQKQEPAAILAARSIDLAKISADISKINKEMPKIKKNDSPAVVERSAPVVLPEKPAPQMPKFSDNFEIKNNKIYISRGFMKKITDEFELDGYSGKLPIKITDNNEIILDFSDDFTTEGGKFSINKEKLRELIKRETPTTETKTETEDAGPFGKIGPKQLTEEQIREIIKTAVASEISTESRKLNETLERSTITNRAEINKQLEQINKMVERSAAITERTTKQQEPAKTSPPIVTRSAEITTTASDTQTAKQLTEIETKLKEITETQKQLKTEIEETAKTSLHTVADSLEFENFDFTKLPWKKVIFDGENVFLLSSNSIFEFPTGEKHDLPAEYKTIWKTVTTSDGKWVIISDKYALSSDDLETWKNLSIEQGKWNDVTTTTRDGSAAFIVAGKCLILYDGEEWTKLEGTTSELKKIIHGGGNFVAIGPEVSLMSSNAEAWYQIKNTKKFNDVIYSDGFYAIGPEGCFKLTGNRWKELAEFPRDNWTHLTKSGNEIAAISSGSFVLYNTETAKSRFAQMSDDFKTSKHKILFSYNGKFYILTEKCALMSVEFNSITSTRDLVKLINNSPGIVERSAIILPEDVKASIMKTVAEFVAEKMEKFEERLTVVENSTLSLIEMVAGLAGASVSDETAAED